MKRILLSGIVSLFCACPASAAVMTFDTLAGDYAAPFSTHTENGFTLTLTSGYAYKASIGDPVAPGVVSYGYNIAYDLTAAGSAFVFEKFGLLVPFQEYTTYQIEGFRSGSSVFSTSGDRSGSSRFEALISPSTTQVDRVTLKFSNYGGVQGSSTIDNLHATISTGSSLPGGPPVPGVPEPATWGMMLLGFGLVGASVRVRRQQVAVV